MSRFLPHLHANVIAPGNLFSKHLFPMHSSCPMNQLFITRVCVLDEEVDMVINKVLNFSANWSAEELLYLENWSILKLSVYLIYLRMNLEWIMPKDSCSAKIQIPFWLNIRTFDIKSHFDKGSVPLQKLVIDRHAEETYTVLTWRQP